MNEPTSIYAQKFFFSKDTCYKNSNLTDRFINDLREIGRGVFLSDLARLIECIQCGMCTGSCPSSFKTAWNIRTIIRRLQLGFEVNILYKNLWSCTTCYTCQERCPKQIPTTDLIRVLRNLAVKHGYIMDSHKRICSFFITSGHCVPINEEVKKIRRELGLPETPPTVSSDLNALKEFIILIDKTCFKNLLRSEA